MLIGWNSVVNWSQCANCLTDSWLFIGFWDDHVASVDQSDYRIQFFERTKNINCKIKTSIYLLKKLK